MRRHYPVARAESQEIIESLVGRPDYNAYENDIAVVTIFFGKPTTIGRNFHQRQLSNSPLRFTEYERIKRMTVIDFISSMGGLFGLCLGFSLISFFEILYWFIIRLARNMLG